MFGIKKSKGRDVVVSSSSQKYPTTSVKNVSGTITPIGSGKITTRAEAISRSTDEGMIWEESPSLVLMLGPVFRLILLLAILSFFTSSGSYGDLARRNSTSSFGSVGKPDYVGSAVSWLGESVRGSIARVGSVRDYLNLNEVLGKFKLIDMVLMAIAFLIVIRPFVLFFRLRTTRYSASSQRLIVETGIFHATNVPYELHLLGDAIISKPLLLRMFGIGNIVISKPGIELLGLRNADYVRDILRTGGQLEAQRIEKIRWR